MSQPSGHSAATGDDARTRRIAGPAHGAGAISSGAAAQQTAPETMEALLQDRYGPPDVLRIAQVRKPVPGPARYWSASRHPR
jgi:hypothetical protein